MFCYMRKKLVTILATEPAEYSLKSAQEIDLENSFQTIIFLNTVSVKFYGVREDKW